MVLPSQFARSDNRRNHMFRKRGLGRLPMWIGGAIVLCLGAWAASGVLLNNDTEDGGGSDGLVANSGGSGGSGERVAPPSLTTPGGSKDHTTRARGDEGSDTRNNGADGLNATDSSHQGHSSGPARDQGQPGQTLEETAELLQRARQHLAYAYQITEHNPLESRHHFTQALASGVLTETDIMRIGVAMKGLSDELVFSPLVVPDDPFTMTYTIKPGDSLEGIVASRSLLVDWRLIKRINHIQDERRIQAGQKIKLVTGPFHAVINKSAFRLDLFLGDGADRVLVRTFKVGLGEYNSTPVGMFRIASRLVNPEWVNPRTRQRYLPDDPANPIGERWLGLLGVDEYTRDFTGYGIHGTIDPDSIGREQSMGCVRMLAEDVELVYEMLLSDVSTVEIRP